MEQLEMSVMDQKIQGLRDRLQGEDDDLQREKEDRRRPGRAIEVNPNLVNLLRTKAVPYRPLSVEIDPPYGLEHTTPAFGIAISMIVGVPLLSLLGLMAWAILR